MKWTHKTEKRIRKQKVRQTMEKQEFEFNLLVSNEIYFQNNKKKNKKGTK